MSRKIIKKVGQYQIVTAQIMLEDTKYVSPALDEEFGEEEEENAEGEEDEEDDDWGEETE